MIKLISGLLFSGRLNIELVPGRDVLVDPFHQSLQGHLGRPQIYELAPGDQASDIAHCRLPQDPGSVWVLV